MACGRLCSQANCVLILTCPVVRRLLKVPVNRATAVAMLALAHCTCLLQGWAQASAGIQALWSIFKPQSCISITQSG